MKLFEIIFSYNIKDFIIKKIEYKDNSIYLYVSIDIEMNYIANGCRPEFDYQVCHCFIFGNQDYIDDINEECYISDYSYDNEVLTIKIKDKTLNIKECNVKVISNCIC